MKKQFLCTDCKIKISSYSKRCKSCATTGSNNPMYGRNRSGKNNPMYGTKGSFFKKKHSNKTRRRMSESAKKLWKSKNRRLNIKRKTKEFWNNPENKRNRIKLIFKAFKLKQNKTEKILQLLLNKIFPRKYKFVGDGKLIIDHFCPDFIDTKNNKIIELFGKYWHTKKGAKIKDKKRIVTYSSHGYKTLIIWDYELNDLKKLENKLMEFNKK